MRMILVLIALLLAVIFAVQNANVVVVRVFFAEFEASLAVVISLCFAVGALLAALALMPSWYRRRAGERRLQARVAQLEASHPSPVSTDPPTPDAQPPHSLREHGA